MSPESPAAETTVAAPRAPRRPKGEGQWALGYREPLNPNERFKKDDDGLNVRARIENIYAHRGFASIDPRDLRGRMRWWGLYTQRKPGIDGGRTAVLEPHELDDEYFMLRIRSDGGQVDLAQLRAIADVSTTYGRDTADVTDRQNIQLHWIRVEDVPAIWKRLEDVGLTTAEACGDTPRVVLGSPVAGVAADEIIDGTPAMREIVENFVGDPRFSNLPRKFKTAISGSPHQDVAHEVNDLSFVGVVHPELGPGFDVWVGGGLSTNPHLAQRLGAWVSIDEIAEVWVGVVSIFRDHGYRRLRSRARLKFLVADWGVERFREVLEKDYLGRALTDGPAPEAPPTGRRDHIGVHPQKRRPLLHRRRADRRPRVRHDARRGRRPRRGRRQRPGALHRRAEAARPRRARATRSTRSSTGLEALGLEADPVVVPPRHDGVHRPGVLQAGDRRDQGPRRRPGRASSRAGSPGSTCR